MRRFIYLLLMMIPVTSFAQTGNDAAPLVLEGANFFVCIVAGILLAMAFQLMLTVLSVAGGITAVGDLEEDDNKKDKNHTHNYDDDDDDGMNMGQKISSGLGAWTMITTSIALFFASLLAVQLGLVAANFIGATLGLVIWAGFFIIMTYLEISAVSSLIGGMVSTVRNSLTSIFSSFSKSEASISKDVARTSAKTQAKEMRKQFEKLFNTNDVDRKIDEYVAELKPQRIDINNLKKQAKDLITDLQVTEKADYDYPNSVKKMILEEADKSNLSKEDKQALQEHVKGLKEIVQGDASNQEKAKQGIEELTPADREQIDKYQKKIKQALENTHKDELQPEQLERDLQKILNEPGAATDIIRSKASSIDRDTLIKIAASQNMEESEAEDYINKLEGVLQKVQSFFGSKKQQASSGQADLQQKVKNMFSGGSSFDLDTIYSDFTSIFQSSGDGTELRYKLEHYNKEEMTTFIARKTNMSRTEAEGIADTIVSARDTVLQKADELQAKVNEKVQEVKEKSIAAAEETRKTAVTAAWWLVGTALLSGAASALGGILALGGW